MLVDDDDDDEHFFRNEEMDFVGLDVVVVDLTCRKTFLVFFCRFDLS